MYSLAPLAGRRAGVGVRGAGLFSVNISPSPEFYLAESRFEDLRQGRSELIPLNDLIRRHGVES